jgi:hypothetical protein
MPTQSLQHSNQRIDTSNTVQSKQMIQRWIVHPSNHILFPSRILTSNKWHNSFDLFKTLIYLSFLSPRISPSHHPFNFFNTECLTQSNLNSAEDKDNTLLLLAPSTAGLNASHKMLLRVQNTAIIYCSYRNGQKQR